MSLEHENLVAGVAPGGFKDPYEVRILVCYLLDTVKEPLSKEQLQLIMQDNHLVNYFTFSQALAQLLSEKHITAFMQDDEEYYKLGELGADTSKMLQHSLPRSVRDRVVSTAMELLSKQKKERENEVIIEKAHFGYHVTFVIHDTEFDLLRFTLFVPDDMQAQTVKKKFLENPLAFYATIIHHLTDTDE